MDEAEVIEVRSERSKMTGKRTDFNSVFDKK